MLPSGWQRCSSRAIAAYRFDAATEVLQVAYTSGRKIYDFPCDEPLFAGFEAAASKGQFVERVLRPHARRLGWSRPAYPWSW